MANLARLGLQNPFSDVTRAADAAAKADPVLEQMRKKRMERENLDLNKFKAKSQDEYYKSQAQNLKDKAEKDATLKKVLESAPKLDQSSPEAFKQSVQSYVVYLTNSGYPEVAKQVMSELHNLKTITGRESATQEGAYNESRMAANRGQAAQGQLDAEYKQEQINKMRQETAQRSQGRGMPETSPNERQLKVKELETYLKGSAFGDRKPFNQQVSDAEMDKMIEQTISLEAQYRANPQLLARDHPELANKAWTLTDLFEVLHGDKLTPTDGPLGIYGGEGPRAGRKGSGGGNGGFSLDSILNRK